MRVGLVSPQYNNTQAFGRKPLPSGWEALVKATDEWKNIKKPAKGLVETVKGVFNPKKV